MRLLNLALLLLMYLPLNAQISNTANETVPEYTDVFRWGTNPGYTPGWSRENLADLAAGNASDGVNGAGCNSLRTSLPHHYIEKWGADINLSSYDYFQSLGLINFTVFLGGVADEFRSGEYHCAESQSKMWQNMYTPIWDEGQNGTPINDNNYFAKYVYEIVSNYGQYIKYWEIINEPDFTYSSAGWVSETDANSWFNTDPNPCDLPNMYAPIEYYIRALRIAYEIIKTNDTNNYVCVGGIGYLSFLDAILRNTDEPSKGELSDDFPNYGGAYFDCVSFHKYPMYGLSEWKDGARHYFRHSDAAIQVVEETISNYNTLLSNYGYNNNKYPAKRYIVTETNLPRLPFGDYIGSDLAQTHYLTKLYAKAPQLNIDQVHTYALRESKTEAEATNEYDVMGFYQSLNNISYPNQVENTSAIGACTMTKLLSNYTYSKSATLALNLPSTIDGVAYLNGTKLMAVLWAKTNADMDETASAEYTFPSNISASSHITTYALNYSKTLEENTIETNASVTLSGSPVLFYMEECNVANSINHSSVIAPHVFPNPSSGSIHITLENAVFKTELYATNGTLLHSGSDFLNSAQLDISGLASGIYLLKVSASDKTYMHKIIKQ